jgi:oxygen-dependent protoporphyrinogen oxidase
MKHPAEGSIDSHTTVDVVVVGAGISGLVAAWELRDLDVLVLEASNRVGGKILSESRGRYWLNLAAHVFPGDRTTLGRVVAEVGLGTEPIRGSTMGVAVDGRIVHGGSPATYPLRLRLPPSARLSLARAGLRIRKAVSEYRSISEDAQDQPARVTRQRLLAYRDDQTFAEFLGPLHPAADALIRAAVNRVAAEPEELAAGAGAAQFAATFSGGSSEFQRNLRGGSSRLPQELHDRLRTAIRLGARATRIANTARGVEITYRSSNESRLVHASAAVLAVPAPEARRVLSDPPEALRVALENIVYGPFVVAAILTDERRPMPWDGLYAVVVPGKSFNMLFNIASLTRNDPPRAPGGSLMVYGASRLGRKLVELSDDDVRRTFVRDLEAVLPEVRGHIEEIVVHRWPEGIPYSRPGRHLYQEALETPVGRIFLAGDYIGQRGGMDTAADVAAGAAKGARANVTR